MQGRDEPARRLRREVPELSAQLEQLRARLQRSEELLARATAPFSGEMTVHQAWARHPGVREVFAARGLPECDLCSVGQDETLDEACQGYGLSLDELLTELNGLLDVAQGP